MSGFQSKMKGFLGKASKKLKEWESNITEEEKVSETTIKNIDTKIMENHDYNSILTEDLSEQLVIQNFSNHPNFIISPENIVVSSSNQRKWIGLWAAKVIEIPDSLQIDDNKKQAYATITNLYHQFLRQLVIYPHFSLELRWSHEPDPSSTSKGKIQFYFIGRIVEDTAARTEKSLEDSWNLFISSFPKKYYSIELVNKDELNFIRSFSEEADTALLFKQEDLSDVQYVTNGDFYYWVNPFPVNLANNLDFIAEAMLGYGENCAISYTLAPIQLEWNEIQAVDTARNFLQKVSQGFHDSYYGQIPPDTNAQQAIQSYEYYSGEVKKPLFLYKIQVWGQGHSLNSLTSSLRSLFTHSNNSFQSDVTIVNGEYSSEGTADKFLSGCWDPSYYQWLSTSNDVPFWESEDAPYSLKRLRYVVTLPEACSFFRLPIAIDNEFPGVKVKQAKGRNIGSTLRQKAGEPCIEFGKIISRNSQTTLEMQLPVESMKKHALIVGVPGSGKTTFTLDYLYQLWNDHKIPFLVIEPSKKEYRSLLTVIPELQVFTVGVENISPFRLNPLDVPIGVRLETHLIGVKTAFTAAFPLGGPLPMLFDKALINCYRDYGWRLSNIGGELPCPPFSAFVEAFKKLDTGYSATTSADIMTAGIVRLESMLNGSRGRIFDTTFSIPMEDLLSKPTVIELDGIMDPDEKALIIALLLIRLNEFIRTVRTSGSKLKHVLLLEEAHTILAETLDTSDEKAKARAIAVELFTNMLAEVRALGQGMIVVDQSPSAVSSKVVRNTGTKLTFRLVEEQDRSIATQSMNMEDEEKRYLTTLTPGEALIYTEGLTQAQLIQTRDFKELYNVQESINDKDVQENEAYWKHNQHKLVPYKECSSVGCTKKCLFHVREESEYVVGDPKIIDYFDQAMSEALKSRNKQKFIEDLQTYVLADTKFDKSKTSVFFGCSLMHLLKNSNKHQDNIDGRIHFLNLMLKE